MYALHREREVQKYFKDKSFGDIARDFGYISFSGGLVRNMAEYSEMYEKLDDMQKEIFTRALVMYND